MITWPSSAPPFLAATAEVASSFLVVVLFGPRNSTQNEMSEVETSLVTLQGASWCVEQDTTVIPRATWMLGYASRQGTVILRVV